MALALVALSGPATAGLAGLGLVVGIGLGVVFCAFFGFGSSARESKRPSEPRRSTFSGDPRVDRALNSLPVGVVVADAVGDPVYHNRFAARFSQARHSDALVEIAIRDLIEAAIDDDAVPGEPIERQLDIYGPPARHLQARASATFDDDALTGCVVLIEDVTAAQHIAQVRKDFVANVSHELRTPIGAISVLAEALADADDPEIVQRMAGRLHHEALRLGDIVDDLLALSKLESGRAEPSESMDLCTVADQAIERIRDRADDSGIWLNGPEASSAPIMITGDPGQMISAIGNLLDNAIKYSESGSEVSVEVIRFNGEAELVVADTGIGIPEADLDRIFERFYRVDNARSRATGGTGLGLSIVRNVVRNHRGTISVSSVEGQGSSFTICLPLADAGPEAPLRSEAPLGSEAPLMSGTLVGPGASFEEAASRE